MREMLNTVQCGDATNILKQFPDNSIDMVITSPPYYKQRLYNESGLGIGQEKCLDYYIEALMETFAECVRVTKPTGNIVYNIGDKYLKGSLSLIPYQFAIIACERLNVKLINEITWVKRNPTPRQFSRRLVSSTEPFFHFSISDDYFYDRANFFKADQETIKYSPSPKLGLKYKALIKESAVLTEVQKKLAYSELIKVISEVHNGEISGFRMKIKGVHAEAFGGQEGGRKTQIEKKGFNIIKMKGEKMKRDVIESQVESLKWNTHTAIFPLTIIRELIRLLCPEKGIVVDPYIGSGTTAIASRHENRCYIGIDIDPSYCVSAKNRINEAFKDNKNVA